MRLGLVPVQDMPVVRLGLDVCSSEGLGGPELRMQLDETGGIVQLQQERPLARHQPFGRGAVAAHHEHAREAGKDGNYRRRRLDRVTEREGVAADCAPTPPR